jgi:hypothetical protein
MRRGTASPTRCSVRKMIRRYGWWLGLGLLLTAAALTTYQFTRAPAAATATARSPHAPAPDPITQSILAYLRAHRGVQPTETPAAPLDPAQQGVNDYLRAHDRVEQQTTWWGRLTQVVRDYLWRQSK